MEGMINTGVKTLEWAQTLGLISAAIAFCIGGFFLIFGGDRGRSKAIGWFVGGSVGLIIVMGAYGIAEGINNNISF